MSLINGKSLNTYQLNIGPIHKKQAEVGSKKTDEPKAIKSFNGIIFRQRDLLEQLKLYQPIEKKAKAKNTNINNVNSSIINVKLSFTSFSGIINILLQDYMEEAHIKAVFAYVQKDYPYAGYQFLKIDFVGQNLVQNLTVLLNKSLFKGITSTLTKNSIKHFIKNQSTLHTWFCSIDLAEISLIHPQLTQVLVSDDHIQYTASCTFNGKQNCHIIFTLYFAIVFQGKDFIKLIENSSFVQKQYWIQTSQDWISFEGKDHLLVFNQRLIQTQKRKQQMMQRKQLQLKNKSTFEEMCVQQNWCETYTVKKQPHVGYSETRAFFSDQHYYQPTFIQQQATLKRRLFQEQINEGQMIDQQEQKQESNYIIEESHLTIKQPSEHDCSIIDASSQMIDQSAQISQLENNQSYQQGNPLEYHFNGLQPSISLIRDIDEKQQMEDITMKTALHFNNENYSKENCQNIININQKNNNNHQSQVSKQNLLGQSQSTCIDLQNSIHNQEIINHFHENNFEIKNNIPSLKRQRSKCIKIQQISPNYLASLSQSSQISFYKRNQQQYNQLHVDINLRGDQIYNGYEQDTLIFTQQQNVYLYNINFALLKQLTTDSNHREIKDVKQISESQLLILNNSKIEIIDIRNPKNTTVSYDFKSEQFFQKFDIFSNIAAVGRSDGLIKLYDLRLMNKRSLNNFDVSSAKSGKRNIFQQLARIQILQSKDIFCQYGESAFFIDSEDRNNRSIFNSKIKQADRTFIKEYRINQKILNQIDKVRSYGDKLQFSIRKNKSEIVSLYKNFEFKFNMKNQTLSDWYQMPLKAKQKCCYLSYSHYSDNSALIQGIQTQQELYFKIK